MKKINLLPIPNQSFTTNINQNRYDFFIRSNDGFMTYDLSINENKIISGFRFVIGQLLIPYNYMEVDGNFILLTPTEEEPNYNNFGSSQILYYLDSSETEKFKEAYSID